VLNDDGPPNPRTSPFISTFVRALKATTDHEINVVLPDRQRSWIGKAHLAGETITSSSYYDMEGYNDGDGADKTAWTLLDGTPASCVQIGISHLFPETEVVVVGPNLGCNISSTFALCSGTLGAAMEGANLCRKDIAVSYEIRKNRDEGVLDEANRLAVRIVEWLLANWDPEVAVYNLNVPLRGGVGSREIHWTCIMDNFWSGSAFTEILADEAPTVAASQTMLVDRAPNCAMGDHEDNTPPSPPLGELAKTRFFHWKPTHSADLWADVHIPGNDCWSINQGYAWYATIFPLSPHLRSLEPQLTNEHIALHR
jgi:tubulin---tyrosine ligase